jgi:hypothetical protein
MMLKMMVKMMVKLNGTDYLVNSGEFEKINHQQFTNLQLKTDLALLERIVSLINEFLCILKPSSNALFINITHGGFIPINCSDNYKNIFICSDDCTQKENIIANIFLHNKSNITFIDNSLIYNGVYDLIFIEDIDTSIKLNLNMSFFAKSIIILPEKIKEFIDFESGEFYKLKNSDYIFYIPTFYKLEFQTKFKKIIKDDNQFEYDNLIHLVMIVKNAGPSFKDILEANIPFIDRWTILDTGSTDNTIDIIKSTLEGNKPGELYKEPFINFRDSRNRCLQLAGNACKFTVTLDDTYILKGNIREFLNTIRGDQFSDSLSLFIESNDVCYSSNRIIKSDRNLRYIYKIHEVITPENNINVIIPKDEAYIFDYRSDYMETRTFDRKIYDIQMLFEDVKEYPNDSRPYYYLGQTYSLLGKHDIAAEYFLKRVNHPNEGFLQEKIDACFEAARLYNFQLNKPWEECETLYKRAYGMDETISGHNVAYALQIARGVLLAGC